MKKEVRGAAGETKAETATRAAKDVATAAGLSTASVGGGSGSAPTEKKVYTQAEKNACSIEAMKNGEICEACQ